MNRYMVIVTAVILGAALIGMSSTGWAEEDADTVYSNGTVKAITAEQLTLSEYDEDTGMYSTVTYYFDPEIKFVNADSYDDIDVGDEVEIEYIITDGKNIAVVLSGEEIIEEDIEMQ